MKNAHEINTEFLKDVLDGFSKSPKSLNSKYFYDAKGDELFSRIMELEEYYLTNSEYEILSQQKEDLISVFSSKDEHFNLVEFGAGNGYKTEILIQYLHENDFEFTYVPNDISGNVLSSLKENFVQKFKGIDIQALQGDFDDSMKTLSTFKEKNVILFLGSNIGNFKNNGHLEFLRRLNSYMKEGDILMLGADMKKDPEIILNAYSDSKGVTAEFNYNYLERMNRELKADFNLECWQHYASYNPITGFARSYLLSKKEQTVTFLHGKHSFKFRKWEPIDMEISRKYSPEDLEQLAHGTGFKVIRFFVDSREYFTDVLFKKE